MGRPFLILEISAALRLAERQVVLTNLPVILSRKADHAMVLAGGIRKMDAITEADCRRRVREELLAAANANDEAVASRHRQRAEECSGRARALLTGEWGAKEQTGPPNSHVAGARLEFFRQVERQLSGRWKAKRQF